MEDILIYGAGGFGREIACLINALNKVKRRWKLRGFIDDGLPVGHSNRYGEVIGDLETLNSIKKKTALVISVATPGILEKLTKSIINPNIWFPNLIAPDVRFHDPESFTIGQGNILFFSCRVSCDVTIGNFNLMNSLVSLGHDVVIGDRNVMNPVVRISGDSRVGSDNFFGLHSIVLQGKKIGNNNRFGVASVVIRNTKDNHLYFGNPARIVKT